jgi:predicted flap endonuclease-1-like 5' DNA nuclease
VNALSLFYQEGPDTSMSWLLLVVLGLFLVIVVVGWLVSRKRGSQPTVQHEAHAEPEMPVVQEKSADDLTMIEGIGPKVSKILNDVGIMSFAELAAADAARVERALDEAGLQMMDPEGWIEQAKLAARGDMEGLKKLQDELKGGRKTS